MNARIKDPNTPNAKVINLSNLFADVDGKYGCECRGTISCMSVPMGCYPTTVGFYGGVSRMAKAFMDEFDGFIVLDYDGYLFLIDIKENPYNCDRCFATLREAIGYVSIEDVRFHDERLGVKDNPSGGFKMKQIHIDVD